MPRPSVSSRAGFCFQIWGTPRVTGLPGTPTLAVGFYLRLDGPCGCVLLPGLMTFIWDAPEFSTIGQITSLSQVPRILA